MKKNYKETKESTASGQVCQDGFGFVLNNCWITAGQLFQL